MAKYQGSPKKKPAKKKSAKTSGMPKKYSRSVGAMPKVGRTKTGG